ncbi:hypothetical protein H2200_001044 [Cladophialophora chaetospira]|uniref:Uncharacterized protein n=1 Tax=Cladophialophora chaetospira TaxID=386627 RepID=A0AA38XKE0_9EURO|nr:hypothetical protein H2200_001044 [Cladophialophora chaetospira]
MSPPESYKLLSVNTAPDRARRMIQKIVEDVKNEYTIIHCANAASIEEVESLASLHQPDILFCASMWTPEQSTEIKRIARKVVHGLRCYAVPQGMQVRDGPEATVEHVKSQLPNIIEGDLGLQ